VEAKAKRTLVKSAPELWELADDLARMEAWMAGLVGSAAPVDVKITDRRPERVLAWRANGGGGAHARIAIELAESGFGTAVRITAQHSRPDAAGADAALERLLDELGSPERRPFSRG
jgi:carbon monoxide dehydrogenase subunit G